MALSKPVIFPQLAVPYLLREGGWNGLQILKKEKANKMEPTNPNASTFENDICPNDTLVRHSCGTLYLGHSCGTLLSDTLVGHSCGDTLVGHSCRKFLRLGDTLEANISHDTTNHPAHQRHAVFTPACFPLPSGMALRTRLPQKLTCQRLQNERFVRDFLQKSSGNTHRSTHITQPCQAASRFQPLQTTPAHTPIPLSQRHSPLPQLTTSRFPAPATNLSASTRLTRTKYCACREMSPPSHLATSRLPAPATRIALPRLKARTKSCACHEK